MPAARYLLEDGSGYYLMEDGTSYYLKEPATVTLGALSALIGDAEINIPATQLTLNEGRNVIFATAAGIFLSASDVPRTLSQLPLWDISVINGTIQGCIDLRTWDGVTFIDQNVIGVNGGLNVSPSGGVSGSLPYLNNSSGVQAGVGSGGSLKSAFVANDISAGYSTPSSYTGPTWTLPSGGTWTVSGTVLLTITVGYSYTITFNTGGTGSNFKFQTQQVVANGGTVIFEVDAGIYTAPGGSSLYITVSGGIVSAINSSVVAYRTGDT